MKRQETKEERALRQAAERASLGVVLPINDPDALPEPPEPWLFRGTCGSCHSVLWTDIAIKTVCLCGDSWLEKNGTFGGKAKPANDNAMIKELQKSGLKVYSVRYVGD